jgi:hypothetical protein
MDATDSTPAPSAGEPRERRATSSRAASSRWAYAVGGAAIAAILLCCGLWGPTNQAGADARYTTVLAETILTRGHALLTSHVGGETGRALSYHVVESAGGEVVSLYPLGAPLAMTPIVAATRALGWGIVADDGALDLWRDNRLQPIVASLLIAVCALLMLDSARREGLPAPLGIAIVVITTFGTTLFSIGSRALWVDTFGCLFLSVALWLVWRADGATADAATASRPGAAVRLFAAGCALSLVLIAAVLMKPPFLMAAAPLLLRELIVAFVPGGSRSRLGGVMAGVAVGAALAVAAVRLLVPVEAQPYYSLVSQLSLAGSPERLAGLLVSPARGLLLYCPFVVALLAMLVGGATWRRQSLRSLGLIAAIAAQLVLLSLWPVWWGGFGYGPRLLVGIMPLIGFLAIDRLGVGVPGRRLLAFFALLGACSIAIHARGALSWAAWTWNERLFADERAVWDWRYPQMLAGLIDEPLPRDAPRVPANGAIPIGEAAGDVWLPRGWSGPEGTHRWTEGRRAVVLVGALPTDANALYLVAQPLLAEGAIVAQRYRLAWNGVEFAAGAAEGPIDVVFALPIGASDSGHAPPPPPHRLDIFLPDAASPSAIGLSEDPRQLGLAVMQLRFITAPGRAPSGESPPPL